MIHANHLTVIFNNHRVLDDVSFDIEKGEIAAVIGPNGSGKSTLIKTLLGFIPYQGSISLFDQAPWPFTMFKKFEKTMFGQIGYVPQKIDFDRTVPVTVMELFGIYNKKRNRKAILSLLNETGVEHLANDKLGQLSGGEFQRVLIALALINNPKLLILDEATAGVDVEGEIVIHEILENLRQKHGLTILFVSHDISLVSKYASQVICLNHRLLCHGAPREALTKEIIDALYAKKTVPYEHKEHRHGHNH